MLEVPRPLKRLRELPPPESWSLSDIFEAQFRL
jgi:hypothetical protein